MIMDSQTDSDHTSVRAQLSAVAKDILFQWNNGYDSEWTLGEPPSDVGLDDIPSTGSTMADTVQPIDATAWNFLEAFVDHRWHGFRDFNGIPWDSAIVLLESLIDHLDRDQPVVDSRMDQYRVRA